MGLGTLTMVDAAAAEPDDHPVVVMETSLGPIVVELRPLPRRRSPSNNFLKYVDAAFSMV